MGLSASTKFHEACIDDKKRTKVIKNKMVKESVLENYPGK
jgi:hypothetical protein